MAHSDDEQQAAESQRISSGAFGKYLKSSEMLICRSPLGVRGCATGAVRSSA
jgi:hypothetical protein